MNKTVWYKNPVAGKLGLIEESRDNFKFLYPASAFESYLEQGLNARGFYLTKDDPHITMFLEKVCVTHGGNVFCKVLWKDKICYVALGLLDEPSKHMIYKHIADILIHREEVNE